MNVLGLSCFYHDAAACLVVDGEVVAAAEEERFSRSKHDNSFPDQAIQYCLDHAGLTVDDLDKAVFYEKPIQKFDRILTTAADVFPHGYRVFSYALPEWLATKLRIRKKLAKEIGYAGELEFVEHHHAHAASAFYPSPFNEAAILTVDGVGEWKTNELFYGDRDGITPLQHITFPDSIGLLYSTITAFLGFMVNNDEYKVMGLAAYGEPTYQDEFDDIIEVRQDGSYVLDQRYFSYRHSKQMWGSALEQLLGPPRKAGTEITQRHKNIAATLQQVLETVLRRQTNHLYERTDTDNLCMAGGVALNSAANGHLLKESPFNNIWIQPAAGDDGGAMGAALERSSRIHTMHNAYLGPSYSKEDVERCLKERGAEYTVYPREDLVDRAVSSIVSGDILGLYQGRMEWGPRALGNRSILADPRHAAMMDRVNEQVKFRESFRPFAPAVLQEYAADYFDIESGSQSPYMLFVYKVHPGKQEDIPAVTHIDGTSRIQTVTRDTNPFYYDIIHRFYEETGVPVLLNTSFNLKGMPIVNTPTEAYDCFTRSGMDAIVTPNVFVTG